jgi:cell division transport system permease protein
MVYADTDATAYDYMKLGAEINSIDYIEEVESVEKGPAYEKELEKLSDDVRDYLKNIDENPLPDGYRITVSDMEHFDEVVNSLKKLENVLRVRENSSLAHQLASIKNSVQYISLGIIILLLIVSLFIISNTIRITMYSRRLEISIIKSAGATNSFIRWPFIVEGINIGIIAGILATLAVWGLYNLTMRELMPTISAFVNTEQVPFLTYAPYIAAAFLVIGIFTGIFGSSTSIGKYLKERKFVELED